MRIAGTVLTITALFYMMAFGAPLSAYIDIPSLLFVVLSGLGIMLSSHGTNVFSVLSASNRPEYAQQRRMIAHTGKQAFIAAGWLGMIFGVIQALGAMQDPAMLGGAAALTLLSVLYGYSIAYFLFLPMERASQGPATPDLVA